MIPAGDFSAGQALGAQLPINGRLGVKSEMAGHNHVAGTDIGQLPGVSILLARR